MKRKIHKYALDPEKTLPYFVDHIGCEKILSERVCEKIDFTKGSFFTTLPEDAFLDRIFNFKCGIIPSIPYGDKTYIIKGRSEPFHPTQVITMNRECSKFIASFLSKNPQNWAVVHDYNLDPKSPHVNRENVKMSPFGSDVHYFLNGGNTVDEIYRTIRKSDHLWYSLIILTQLKDGVPNVLIDLTIDQICENAQFVITGAYDGDGHIFWQPKENLLLEKK